MARQLGGGWVHAAIQLDRIGLSDSGFHDPPSGMDLSKDDSPDLARPSLIIEQIRRCSGGESLVITSAPKSSRTKTHAPHITSFDLTLRHPRQFNKSMRTKHLGQPGVTNSINMKKIWRSSNRHAQAVAPAGYESYDPKPAPGMHEQAYQRFELSEYELPGPVNSLAVVSPRSDIGFARAMAPPGRYQGEVGASNFSPGEENDLSGTLGFSGVALDMVDAESLEEKGEGSGGGGSEIVKAKVIGPSLLSGEDVHQSSGQQLFIHSVDVPPLSATLSAPFSLPGPSFSPTGLRSKVEPLATSYPKTWTSQQDQPSLPRPMPTQRQLSKSYTVSPQPTTPVSAPRDQAEITSKHQRLKKSSKKKSLCCF